jgi:hypothetical protein
MSRLGQSYDISRPSGHCAKTGEAIQPGQTFVAVLVESPEHDHLLRADVSPGAWEGGFRPDGRVFGFWRAVMPDPSAPKKILLEEGELADIFAQLVEAGDDANAAFRFVLALVLIRKRVLIYEGTTRDRSGKPEAMLVRWARSAGRGEETLTVPDPGMDESAVDEVLEQIGSIMAQEQAGG